MSSLDPVQIAALEFADGKQGVGWFMEQGLGETLTALTEFSFLYQTGKVDRMIVICPNTFKKGWLDEIEKHGFAKGDAYLALVEEGRRRQLAEQASRQAAGPDHQLRGRAHAEVNRAIQIWAARGDAYLAIDESIQIKGHKSAQTKAIHKLAAWSPFTGDTMLMPLYPDPDGETAEPQERDGLVGSIASDELVRETNFYSFRGAFAVMGGWECKQVIRPKNEDQLARCMAHCNFSS